MIRARFTLVVGLAAAASLAPPAAAVAAAKHHSKTVTVCRRGCAFSSIQKAVDRVAKHGTVRVKPGTYHEGVIVKGKRKDRITIRGTAKAKRVILSAKGAKDKDGNRAQNGVFIDGADKVTLKNLSARHFPGNGFFVRNANGYKMDHLVAAYNRAYGLYAFNSKGGRMTRSTGYGHGDSAFYVGQTPVQSHPKRTKLDHLKGYMNVLGYSGTNSKYVDITHSDFYNNGAGVVPNTLKSEKYSPAEEGTIRHNRIFWNNFNYFSKDSKVKPLPPATSDGDITIYYPTGAGVVLLGTTGWKVSDNAVFGNFKWGMLTVSDPTYDKAVTIDNTISGNRMGNGGADVNAVDFMSEGSGRGNCYADNGAGATFDPGSTPATTLYPVCANPRPANAPDGTQLGELLGYLTQQEGQEDSWSKHPHHKVGHYKPIDGEPVK